MEKLFKSSLYLSLFSIAAIPLSYLIRLTLTRELTLEEFGLFYAILSFFDLLQSFNDVGFSETQLYFLPKYILAERLDKIKAVIYVQFINQIVTTGLIGVAVFFLTPWIAETLFHTEAAGDMIRILIWYFLAKDFLMNIKVLFHSFQDAKVYGSGEAIRMILTTALLVAAVGFPSFSILSVAWIWVAVHLSMAIGYFALFMYQHPEIWSAKAYPIRQVYREFIPYLLPTLLTNKAGNVYSASTELMLSFFKGVADVGLFNIAKPISNLALALTAPVASALKPYVSEIDEQVDSQQINNIMQIIINFGVFFLAPFSFMLFFYAPESITFLFGIEFIGAAWTLRIIAFDIMFVVLSPFVFGILFGLGLLKERTKVIYACVALNFMLSLILIPWLGPAGLGLASLTYSISAVLGGLWMIRRKIHFTIPWQNYLQILFLCMLLLVSQQILKSITVTQSSGQLVLFVGKVLVGLCLYFLLGVYYFQIVDRRFILNAANLVLPKKWQSTSDKMLIFLLHIKHRS